MTLDIILLAMVAAFLGLRLYSVLGKRTGHEQESVVRQAFEERPATAIRPAESTPEPSISAPATDLDHVDFGAQSGLRSVINADRQFDTVMFLEGAKAAYGAILESFWKGDRESLRTLCDEDVYDSFVEVIDTREAAGETLENRLVRIDKAHIVAASYDHPTARITVRFDADIAALVKDKEGRVIGGSMTDAIESHDIWTFMRDVKSGGRNWKLDETDEA